MRANILAFVIAVGLLPAFANRAAAFVVINPHTVQALYECSDDKLYDADSKDAPEIIARSFEGEGRRIVFRTCRDYDGNTHYFIRKPRPNRNSVCRIFESEIFPGSETDFIIVDVLYNGMEGNWSFDMKGWTGMPPQEWIAMRYAPRSSIFGFVTNESCPLGQDPRYIPVGNASDGLLTSFQSYWEKITRSPESLKVAIQKVPTISGPWFKVDATPSQKLRERFMTAVIEKHSRITGIYCDTSGCQANLQSQSVGFDVGSAGIALTYLAALWVA